MSLRTEAPVPLTRSTASSGPWNTTCKYSRALITCAPIPATHTHVIASQGPENRTAVTEAEMGDRPHMPDTYKPVHCQEPEAEVNLTRRKQRILLKSTIFTYAKHGIWEKFKCRTDYNDVCPNPRCYWARESDWNRLMQIRN